MSIELQPARPDITNNKFFKRLYNLALDQHKSSEKMVAYHACAIVRGGNILGIGTNNKKQNQIVRLHYAWFCGSHAETAAILDAKKSNLRGADVYVMRVRTNGEIAHSAPCDWCIKLLSGVGVKRAFYSTESGEIDCIKIRPTELNKNELYTYRNIGIAVL